MSWNIFLFETGRGEKPVKKFVKSCSPEAIAKISQTIKLLEQYGSYLNMPHSKKLSREIYELRICGKEEIRILYCFKKKDIYLLHGFKKQSQKTPAKDLKVAFSRMRLLT